MRIVTALPDANFERPTAEDMRRLRAIVATLGSAGLPSTVLCHKQTEL
ncbi:MAG: hypothetical protein WCF81_21440 [Roseiarcus sp.]